MNDIPSSMKPTTFPFYTLMRSAGALLTSVSIVTGSAQTVTFERLSTDPLGADLSFNAAWADYDGDGFVDVCTVKDRITLYRNNGDGGFTRITTGNPLVEAAAPFCNGVIWGDYDNDGLPDVFVFSPTPSSSRNYLFHNEGDGSFTEVLEGHVVSSVPTDVFAGSAVWGDFNGDGWLDLFVGNWITESGGQTPNYLYRNDSGAGFSLVSDGVMGTSYSNVASSQGSVTGDFDNDGRLDILNLAVAPTPSRIYRNLGDFNFELLYPMTDAINGTDRTSGGAAADYDNDGDLDLLTGAMANYPPSPQLNGWSALWENDGSGSFTRVREGEIVAPNVIGTLGMAWGDYDNDGWLDVILSRGAESNAKNDETFNFLFHNNGDGTFAKVTEGDIVTDTGASMNSTWADINNDGFLDLLVCNYDYQNQSERNLLMLNTGNSNHWLKLTLQGTDSNVDAIGTKARVKATIRGQKIWQLREIGTSQGEFASQSDMRPNFGLGDATVADIVRIEWPSGTVQELTNIAADQILEVVEPPRLRVETGGQLSWSLTADGFQLESTSSIDGSWSEATETVETNGSRKSITIQPDGGSKFYRLNGQ